MRVLTQVPAEFLEFVKPQFPDVEFVEVPMTGPVPDLSGEVLFTWTRGAENLPEVLEGEFQWIHSLTTGVDDFPLELVGDRVLTCARGAAAVPIGEWVIAVMLAFEKQLPDRWLTEPAQEWLFAPLGTLHRRRLALVGFGTIGRRVARLALGFGMRVSAVRRTETPSTIDGVQIVGSLDELLCVADHIVLAAPATPSTSHLLDGSALSSVKRGAHFVNVARGSLVDQDALRAALDDGRIARASLDSTTPEPLPAGHWMYEHPSIRLSPHVAWNWPHSIETTAGTFTANLKRWLRNEPLDGVIDLEQQY